MKKFLILSILCFVSACQITSVPPEIDTQNNKAIRKTPVSSDNFPPMVLSIDPEPGTLIHLKQKFTIEFSQEMEQKSVEAAFELDPLVAGRFEWVNGKKVSFLPDQELPVSQKITLRINQFAANLNGDKLGNPFLSQFQVADPLKVAYKFPESGTVDVDTSTSGIYLTFNQPVLSKLNDLPNPPIAFKIKPDQSGHGEWINNSTYLYSLDNGLAGGTDFQIEINRQLKSIYGTNFEISSESNWQFKTIEPGILQFSPSVNEPIPLDQTFKLIFNQAMQTETVAANFYFEDVAGNPVQGRFYWNDQKTEMTFVPEMLLNRESTYILELMPGSLVSGGTPFRNQVSLTYTTIQAFQLLSTIPANQQPLDIIDGESKIELLFSSSLSPELNFQNYISVNPAVEDIKFLPDSLNNSLVISGSLKAGQTYQVMISKFLPDKIGSTLDQDYFFEYFVSPPDPMIKVEEIFGNNFLLLNDRNPKINFDVVNIQRLSLLLERLSFSEFASIQNKETLVENGIESRQMSINTNILPNQNKNLEIDLEKFKLNLSPGIYRLTFTSENDYRYQLFILINHYSIYSKSSENQLFIWLPNYDEALNTKNSKIRVFNDAFQFLYETDLDKSGTAIIEPYLYGKQNLSSWIEFGTAGEKNYSLVYVEEDRANDDGVNNQIDIQTLDSDFETFFISDQLVYRPKDKLHFYAVLRSNDETGFSIPGIKEFKFFLKNIDSDDIVEQTNVILSELGTLTGEISLPENLSEGSYQIGFEPQIIPNRIIYVENENQVHENFSIKFNSNRYVIGDKISIFIEISFLELGELNKGQIHWTLGYSSVKDGINDSNVIVDNSNPVIIAENSQSPDDKGRLTVEINSQDLINSLPSLSHPYLLTATLELINSEKLPMLFKSESIIYPERYRIDVETDAFYLNDPESIKAKIYSKSLDQKLIGAIPVNVILEKAITGIKESEIDEWGGLYKGFLRTDGQGFVEYEAFLNGPGIYKLTLLSGKWNITKIFYVAGKGKTQYPLSEDKIIPIVLEKNEFTIDDSAKIFIPNPYNGPAIALLTIERENVLFQNVLEIADSYLLYELPIKKEYGPNAFISLLMVEKEGFQQYKFGTSQIFVNLNEKKLTINADFSSSTNDDNSISVDIFIKDDAGQPAQSEIFIQSIRSVSQQENDQDLIFEEFYHNRQNMVSSNFSGMKLPFIDTYGNTEKQNSINYENINLAETLWVQRVDTDENGHIVIDFPSPYDSNHLWMKIFAVTSDLKIGNLTKSIPPGFTASIIPHVPQYVNKGDKFQLGLLVTNLLDFPQTLDVNLEIQNLFLTGESLKQVTLGVGESKEIYWQVMAEKSGNESVNFLVLNPAKESINISQSINVKELPSTTKTVVNGYISSEGQQNYYYGISKSSNFVEGVITTYMIPGLLSNLMAGIQDFPNNALTVEQKAWSLLAHSHLMQLIQTSGVDEPGVEKRLQEKIQELTQSLILAQNKDGGWSKSTGSISDPYLTAYCTWGLKLSESLLKVDNNLNLSNALDYMMSNLSDPESIRDTALIDKQALLYFAINFVDNEKINLYDFIPYIKSSSNEGKIFLSLALEMNNRGDKQARALIKEVENSIEKSASDFSINDNQFSLGYFKSRSSQIALTIYALSSIDPANIVLEDLVPDLMNSQKSPGQWDSVLETSIGLIALSQYLQGRGIDNGLYEFDAFLNNIHIINGSAIQINFLPPISNQYEIENMDDDQLFDLKINRSGGKGTLYFLTKISFLQMINDINSSNSEFTIQRYFYYPESEIDLPDCINNLCFGKALTVAKSIDGLIQVYLVVTTSKDQQNVFLEENIPAGMILNDITESTSIVLNGSYDPLIRYSENFIKYQNQTQSTINWFAEELPAGTYVVSYFLTPEYIGQFSLAPASIWSRFSSSDASHNSGQTLTIINR